MFTVHTQKKIRFKLLSVQKHSSQPPPTWYDLVLECIGLPMTPRVDKNPESVLFCKKEASQCYGVQTDGVDSLVKWCNNIRLKNMTKEPKLT